MEPKTPKKSETAPEPVLVRRYHMSVCRKDRKVPEKNCIVEAATVDDAIAQVRERFVIPEDLWDTPFATASG